MEICQICNKNFKAITSAHLIIHNYTYASYVFEYGDIKNFTSLIGQTFGYLTVIEHTKTKTSSKGSRSSHRGSYWKCKCICGVIKVIAGNCLKQGNTVSCGCYQRKMNLLRNSKAPQYASFISKHRDYFDPRKLSRISNKLTKLEHHVLFKQKCFYCDEVPKGKINHRKNNNGNLRYSAKKVKNKTSEWYEKINNSTYFYNGIDRINSGENYDLNNCVTACKMCNFAKRDVSFIDFIDWISRISKNPLFNSKYWDTKIIFFQNHCLQQIKNLKQHWNNYSLPNVELFNFNFNQLEPPNYVRSPVKGEI